MLGRAATLSDAARAFMDAAESAPQRPDDLPIEELRRLTREGYAKAARDAVIEHKVALREIEIANVPCLQIIPPNVKSGRVMIYIFGGGFMVGSPFEDLPISAFLATRLGCTIICPNYRLAPEHQFPAALNDVEAVAVEVLQNNDDVLLAGESAGGNLTLALYQRLRAKNLPMPKAMAALSPAVDQSDIGDSGRADRDPLLAAKYVVDVVTAYAPGYDLTHPELSPIYGEYGPETPPTIITTGSRDLFLSSCIRQERVMRSANAQVTLRVWEGMGHVFEFYPDIPEARASLSEIADFLESHLS
jgi:epsilon-lactone hydrolase